MDVAVLRTLGALDWARHQAAPTGYVRAEPREVADGRQTAFDVTVSGSGDEDFWEVKREPPDVPQARMVAAKETAALQELDRFVAHVAEATDLDHLERLVGDGDDNRQRRLLDATGPGVTLGRLATILRPDTWPVTWVKSRSSGWPMHCRVAEVLL
jgi:hypothetical protein